MKVLHLLSSNKLSGAENVVADICMMFDGEYEMAYCSPEGTIRQALNDRKVKFLPLKKLTISEVRSSVKYFNPDIIHAHDVRATILATLASGKEPIISHLHGNIEDMRKFGLKSLLYMLATKRTKLVLSVSESILIDYIFNKHIEKKTVCLRNIIYTPRINELMVKDQKDYYFDFVYIGRLAYPKNPQRVAEVASKVLKNCPNVTFGVIGNGDLKKEMEKVFIKEGIADRVTFTGNLAYPYKALKQAKCMLMCSRFEGTPIAALEAMALGVPIVSTPVDGLVNLVTNNETGFLHSENTDLACSVDRLINNKELYSRMSLSSLEKFKNINLEDEFKERIREAYQSTIIN